MGAPNVQNYHCKSFLKKYIFSILATSDTLGPKVPPLGPGPRAWRPLGWALGWPMGPENDILGPKIDAGVLQMFQTIILNHFGAFLKKSIFFDFVDFWHLTGVHILCIFRFFVEND